MAIGFMAVGLDDNDDVVMVIKNEDGSISTTTLSESRARLLSSLLDEASIHNEYEHRCRSEECAECDETEDFPWGNGVDIVKMCDDNDFTPEELNTLFKTAATME